MPNNKYIRSTKKERKVVNDKIREGYDVAARCAGSKSKGPGFATDVFAVNHRTKTIDLIQVKTTIGSRSLVTNDIRVLDGYTLRETMYIWE
jgi:Holliday junction resolvase